MFNLLSYRKTRAVQIALVLATAIIVQKLLGYSHAGWIGFAVMMIYAGFDKGASLQRTTHRFWGVMLGLLLSYILWFIGQFNFRLIIVFAPIVIFMAYFTLGKLYAIPTIFTVTLTALGTDYYTINDYGVANFFFDYVLSTVIAFGICAIFELYIFSGSHLSHKFYLDLQRKILRQLNQLFIIVTTYPLRRGLYLKGSMALNLCVLELYDFVEMAKYDKHRYLNLIDDLAFFSSEMQQAYHNIRRLFILSPQKNDLLILETENILEQLTLVNQNQRVKHIGEGLNEKN